MQIHRLQRKHRRFAGAACSFQKYATAKQKNTEPYPFGLPLPDTIAPISIRLAIYDREQRRTKSYFSLVKKDSFYTTVPPIIKVVPVN